MTHHREVDLAVEALHQQADVLFERSQALHKAAVDLRIEVQDASLTGGPGHPCGHQIECQCQVGWNGKFQSHAFNASRAFDDAPMMLEIDKGNFKYVRVHIEACAVSDGKGATCDNKPTSAVYRMFDGRNILAGVCPAHKHTTIDNLYASVGGPDDDVYYAKPVYREGKVI